MLVTDITILSFNKSSITRLIAMDVTIHAVLRASHGAPQLGLLAVHEGAGCLDLRPTRSPSGSGRDSLPTVRLSAARVQLSCSQNQF